MATKKFEKINLVKRIVSEHGNVEIHKVRKVGTKRTFFAPEYNGRALTNTKYARLTQAESTARHFINEYLATGKIQ